MLERVVVDAGVNFWNLALAVVCFLVTVWVIANTLMLLSVVRRRLAARRCALHGHQWHPQETSIGKVQFGFKQCVRCGERRRGTVRF